MTLAEPIYRHSLRLPEHAVACGKPELEDAEVDTLLNPMAIVEVLSTSEQYDRGAELLHYRTQASLQDYLLVAQTEYRAEHYVRQPGNRWLLTKYRRLEETIDLAGGRMSPAAAGGL